MLVYSGRYDTTDSKIGIACLGEELTQVTYG